MKHSDKFIRIGLVVMVLLSFYFSYMIWFNPATNQTTQQVDESKEQVVSNTQEKRKAADLFLPLRVVRFSGDTIQESNGENMISHLQTVVGDGTYGKLKMTVNKDEDAFKEKQTMTSGFEFNYTAPFSLKEYKSAYELSLEVDSSLADESDISFSRVQFDQKNEKIRFFDFVKKRVYEADCSINWTKIKKIQSNGSWTNIANADDTIAQQYDTSESIKLKKYSYILSQQPYTLFRNAFFQKTTEVKNNEESKDLIFYGDNETLTVHSENQVVDFHGTLMEDVKDDTIFGQSYPYVSMLGNNLGSLRYFDRDENTLIYRTFVEGFPVFGTNSKGEFSIEINSNAPTNEQVKIETSLNAIQVPIPSDEEVELPSTTDVIDQLTNAGAENDKISS
ncbi:MAG: two-component system activity regulator YycH, partial [Enterococcus sp.]